MSQFPSEPLVRILLSTYNGARFLREQLDSVRAQEYPRLELVIRDDGSSDDTVSIVESFQTTFKSLRILRGGNVGVVASCLELLALDGDDDQLFAFCDQDDVWHPERISHAVSAIVAHPDPRSTLHCSTVNYVNEELTPLRDSEVPRDVSFGNALVENVIVGCSSTMGNSIRRRVLQARASAMLMHDHWAYLVATAFGSVVFDPRAGLKYRRHGKNASPWERYGWKRLAKRLRVAHERRITRTVGIDVLRQAQAFLDTYNGDLSPYHRRLAEDVLKTRGASLLERLAYAATGPVHRNRLLDDVALRLLIVFDQH